MPKLTSKEMQAMGIMVVGVILGPLNIWITAIMAVLAGVLFVINAIEGGVLTNKGVDKKIEQLRIDFQHDGGEIVKVVEKMQVKLASLEDGVDTIRTAWDMNNAK